MNLNSKRFLAILLVLIFSLTACVPSPSGGVQIDDVKPIESQTSLEPSTKPVLPSESETLLPEQIETSLTSPSSASSGSPVPSTEEHTTEPLTTLPNSILSSEPLTIPETSDSVLVVHFIDVGQADCILAQLPNGEILLIDGGNKADGNEVCKYLRDLGIHRIDYLVATHPHEDHIGGLPLVIRSFEIGEIYAPKATATTNIFEDFLKSIQEKGMTIHSAQAGQTILASHDLSLDILAPKSASYKDLNDYSVVIKLTFKKNTFLFMGDAETISEGEIKADVNVDVLKVGHHGSDSSSSLAFLQKATPSISVISCGAGNSYGHPKDITLKHLSEVGSEIYRTDLQGTILITSDGSQISVNQKPSTAVSLQPTTVNVTTTKPSTVPSTTVPSSKPSTTVPSSKPSTTVPSTQPSTAPTPVTQPNTVPPTVAQTKPVVPSNITVFVTETGTKYHKEGCRYLSDSKIPMELEQAKLTYTPCKVCKPPE